ncbi:hypothetical protein [Trueperella sp. LYQ141]|uniref:hypothetical protein n=1 Tax=Trueperella sp. LYQ141 TaxID=3391058 RepID=UPI0039839282
MGRKNIGKMVLTGVLACGAILTTGLPALAGGMSSTTHGCYAQWYNTYSKGMCELASTNGRVQLWADQGFQTDYSGPFVRVVANRYYRPFDDNEARFTVRTAEVNWRDN